MHKTKAFISSFNRKNGKIEWLKVNDNYDYCKEIKMSNYTDMLNDRDRNIKYFKAMKITFDKLRQNNKEVHVLDIGSGTGLLSIMAVKLGADSVTACESFHPMYKISKKIIETNHIPTDKLHLLQMNSNDLIIGKDMPRRANVLVSEVFDSQLVGEGVLSTFQYAKLNLLTRDFIIIPYSAEIYLQGIQSEYLSKSNCFTWNSCPGNSYIYELHASELYERNLIKVLTDPIMIERINFCATTTDKYTFNNSNLSSRFVVKEAGGCLHGFVFWWKLKMTQFDDSLEISTHPRWIDPEEYYWREHWMQGYFNVPQSIDVVQGQVSTVELSRNKYAYWLGCSANEKHSCICGLHNHFSQHKISQINSQYYRENIKSMIEQIKAQQQDDKSIVVLSDSDFLQQYLENLGYSNIVTIRENSFLPHTNRSLNIDEFLSSNIKPSILLSDLIFSNTFYPWDEIYVFYVAKQLACTNVCPGKMILKGVFVEFEGLEKIFSKVVGKNVCGLVNMQCYNDWVFGGFDLEFEMKQLCEYKVKARSDIFDVIAIDSVDTGEVVRENIVNLPSDVVVNGLVLWSQWTVDDSLVIDYSFNGIGSDSNIEWKGLAKQAIGILSEENLSHIDKCELVKFQCRFDVEMGDFQFKLIGL